MLSADWPSRDGRPRGLGAMLLVALMAAGDWREPAKHGNYQTISARQLALRNQPRRGIGGGGGREREGGGGIWVGGRVGVARCQCLRHGTGHYVTRCQYASRMGLRSRPKREALSKPEKQDFNGRWMCLVCRCGRSILVLQHIFPRIHQI